MAERSQVQEAEHEVSRQREALGGVGSDSTPAWDELVPLVYEELRAIAHAQLRRERDSHTLSTTALVHETYLRLLNQRRAEWRDPSHFFAVAARVMRRVLIDYARRHRAVKRAGALTQVPLDGEGPPGECIGVADDLPAVADERAELLVALDDALTRLAAFDKRLVRVVECRFFAGLSEDETATALGVTARTVRRDWVKAKDRLRRALET